MSRVSTLGNYESALLNLMSAQTRALEAQERVSTQKVATDLGGFGRGAETLTAMKSMQARLDGFIATGEAVSTRLSTQALAFDQVIAGADSARQAIADALAAGRVDGLMQELQNQFGAVQQGLNLKHQGQYLFGGANGQTAPVSVSTLADLAAAPDVASVFENDTLAVVSRLDEATSLKTGFLADDLGAELFAIFREVQEFHTGAGGPIDGQPSTSVTDFLEGVVARLKVAHTNVTNQAARNGAMQNRVENLLSSHADQKLSLEELISGKTDADPLQAVTDLQLAQISIQASAQVVAQLRQTSLLDILQP